VLETGFVVTLLRTYHRNFGKQLTKHPKLYFTDTGTVCALVGIREPGHIANHPLRGPIFENLVVGEYVKFPRGGHQEPIEADFQSLDDGSAGILPAPFGILPNGFISFVSPRQGCRRMQAGSPRSQINTHSIPALFPRKFWDAASGIIPR